VSKHTTAITYLGNDIRDAEARVENRLTMTVFNVDDFIVLNRIVEVQVN